MTVFGVGVLRQSLFVGCCCQFGLVCVEMAGHNGSLNFNSCVISIWLNTMTGRAWFGLACVELDWYGTVVLVWSRFCSGVLGIPVLP